LDIVDVSVEIDLPVIVQGMDVLFKSQKGFICFKAVVMNKGFELFGVGVAVVRTNKFTSIKIGFKLEL
jgi:hypothetical protein